MCCKVSVSVRGDDDCNHVYWQESEIESKRRRLCRSLKLFWQLFIAKKNSPASGLLNSWWCSSTFIPTLYNERGRVSVPELNYILIFQWNSTQPTQKLHVLSFQMVNGNRSIPDNAASFTVTNFDTRKSGSALLAAQCRTSIRIATI